MKNLEQLNQPLNQKMNDFDKEKQNLPRTSEDWQIVSELRSEVKRISPEIFKHRLKVKIMRFKVYQQNYGGRCAFANIIQPLTCPGEIWATQRAFLVAHQEEGSAVQALCLCGSAQSVRADWLTEDEAGSSGSQSPD